MESMGIHLDSNISPDEADNPSTSIPDLNERKASGSTSSTPTPTTKSPRYIIIPISFVNSGKQYIHNALKEILPNTIIIKYHGISWEKFYGKLSHAFDNDKVQVLIVHRNNAAIFDRLKIYEAVSGFGAKYSLKFIVIQYVQKDELSSDSFMNRLINDIIINDEINDEDLSIKARGPARIREIVNSTRNRFQNISFKEKKYFPLIINLDYNDDKFFEYLKTIVHRIHETYPELLPTVLVDEEIAKYTYEADSKEVANARDFYSNGAANLQRYELDAKGEFSDCSNPLGLRAPKPHKYVIIQCSTLGTGKKKITNVLENNLVKPELVEATNQNALFKDLSRAFIKHTCIILTSNNYRYSQRNMIIHTLKRFLVNYQIHTICLDYINTIDHTTFHFFQRSINYLLSWDFDAFPSKLQTLTLTNTEAQLTRKLISQFDKLTPQEIRNYEAYIPLTYEHERIHEYLIQIHTQLSKAYGSQAIFHDRFRLEAIAKLAYRADLRERTCWKYYHESIGYNETSFKPDLTISHETEKRSGPANKENNFEINRQAEPKKITTTASKNNKRPQEITRSYTPTAALLNNYNSGNGIRGDRSGHYQSINSNEASRIGETTQSQGPPIWLLQCCVLFLLVVLYLLYMGFNHGSST